MDNNNLIIIIIKKEARLIFLFLSVDSYLRASVVSRSNLKKIYWKHLPSCIKRQQLVVWWVLLLHHYLSLSPSSCSSDISNLHSTMEAGDTEGSTLEESDIIEIIPTGDYDIGKVSEKETPNRGHVCLWLYYTLLFNSLVQISPWSRLSRFFSYVHIIKVGRSTRMGIWLLFLGGSFTGTSLNRSLFLCFKP